MILAYHCIFSAYGFWLPNDPRGSGSDHVASWDLFRYGPPTKVTSRRSVAHRPHDTRKRIVAKSALKYPPVSFTGQQALTITKGFTKAATEANYIFHACAVLPDHVHLVLARHPRKITTIVSHLKSQATRKLRALPEWPNDDRPVWGERGWNVYLDNPAAVLRAIRYVNNNPPKEGLLKQRWSFITPYITPHNP